MTDSSRKKTAAAAATAAAMSPAESLKTKGNAHYLAGEYDEALSAYSKAITNGPENPVYYFNRSLVYVQKGEWELAVQDCEKALLLHPEYLKCHFILGLALQQLHRLPEAINSFQEAYDLCLKQKASCIREVVEALAKAQRTKWEQEEEAREIREREFHSYLKGLIEADRQRAVHTAATSEDHASIQRSYDEKLSKLRDLFVQVDDSYKKREVPDYLCSAINFEIMKDPVITPSGITYDRSSLLEHIRRVGHFDPITRQKLSEVQLIPNIALKQAIDDFLQRNSWAIEL